MPKLTNPYKKVSNRKTEIKAIYHTKKWRNLREIKLSQCPICEECLKKVDEDHPKGIITPATQVHHIISFWNFEGSERERYAYDLDNLQSLCDKCHEAIHGHREKIDINYYDKWEEITSEN